MKANTFVTPICYTFATTYICYAIMSSFKLDIFFFLLFYFHFLFHLIFINVLILFFYFISKAPNRTTTDHALNTFSLFFRENKT